MNLLRVLLVTLVFPVFIGLLIFISKYQSPIKVGPDNDDYTFWIGSDSDSGGNSIIHEKVKNDNFISFTYELKSGVDYPYAYLEIRKKSFLDLSKYNSLNVKLDTEKSKSLTIIFYCFIDNYTDLDNFSTYLPLTYVLPLEDDKIEYEIDLNKFKIPDWWLYNYKIDDKNINNSLFRKVAYINLANNPLFPLNEVDKITFYNFDVFIDKDEVLKITIIAISLYYLLLLILFLLKIIKYKKDQYKLIRYNSINTLKNSTRIDKLEKYIGLNFSNASLNLTTVSEELNISERKISNEIKTKYNLTFPAYLNLIRVNEAKDLLTETDHKILDIAIAVGYNNATHFNRIFRKLENITPTNYRKEHKCL